MSIQVETKPMNIETRRRYDGTRETCSIFIKSDSIQTKDEFLALFQDWPGQFGDIVRKDERNNSHPFIDLEYGSSNRELHVNPETRREWALLPAVLRKAIALSYRIYYWRNDAQVPCYEPESKIFLDEEPALFWQALALHQMWYEK